MYGYVSASNQSPERRWLSRLSLPVLTLATAIRTSTLLFSGSAGSKARSISKSSNCPLTGVKKCLTEKLTSVWGASTFQGSAARSAG
jgi:hypothetical protein